MTSLPTAHPLHSAPSTRHLPRTRRGTTSLHAAAAAGSRIIATAGVAVAALLLSVLAPAALGAEGVPEGRTTELRREALSDGAFDELLRLGKTSQLDLVRRERLVSTITDHLPEGWGTPGKPVDRADSWGNPIVNQRPGLPDWAQRDVDNLRLAIANTAASLRDLPEDLRGPTEDLLGNYLGQALVRGIDLEGVLDVRGMASPQTGRKLLGFLHAYENRNRELAPIEGFKYLPTDYSHETVSLIEYLGGSLEEIRAIESAEAGDATGPGAQVGTSDCYSISTPELFMAALSGSTSIWSGTTEDDAEESIRTPFSFQFFGCGSDSVFSTSTIRVSTNGLALFRDVSGGTNHDNAPIWTGSDPNGFAAPSWDDYQVRFGLGFIDRVSYKTEGTVGQRIFVVEWRSVGHVGGEVFDTHSFQLVLGESNGSIEFRYGAGNPDETVDSATVGLESNLSSQGACLDCSASNGAPTSNLLFVPTSRPTNDAHAQCIDYQTDLIGTNGDALGAVESSCGTADVHDVWYYFDAPDRFVRFSTCTTGNSIDTTIAVGRDGSVDEACGNDDCGALGNQSEVGLALEGGTRYYVRVAGDDGAQGPFRLRVIPPISLVGDACEEAILLDGSDVAFTSTTSDNSGCGTESSSPQQTDTIDEWTVWTAPISGNAVATTCGATELDTTLAIFDACGGTELAFNDDFGSGGRLGVLPCTAALFKSRVSWPVSAGTTYRLRVAGFSERQRGAYDLLLRVSPLFSDDFEWGNTAAWTNTVLLLP